MVQLKKPCCRSKFSRVRHARYLGREDAFEVEFEDGLCFLESHATIKRATRISAALPVSVEVDDDLGSYFEITYDTGKVAEVLWSFVRELSPQKASKVAEVPGKYTTKRGHRSTQMKRR
jgi:hypothetical protein